ncbi:hypothetical protein [Desulfosporosinus sp. Sb-LF]|uniref:hypothetical protein n=1 Tax=Desulfosporosinus sp. Sb-LF TaxID=2560027 RepID=UPI00107EF0C6|nr:hypothetical protein [Desulfosporosinus sp. Sb-LF]TGE33296.1 hypothetical protein E4K68_07310 [Desulfosporosinus sp. Sb-LF]
MLKQTQVHKSTKRTWIVAGMLLSFTIIGLSGCGSTNTTSSPATATTQSSSSSQQNQGQTTQKMVQNPALKAVMEISRLQRDQQNALTSDQKAKIKPILQELISTPDLSQDSLQQKADAINAVLTDQQKTVLTAPRTPNGTKQNPNSSNGNSTNGNRPQGGTGGKQAGNAPKPGDMYQRVLDSLS